MYTLILTLFLHGQYSNAGQGGASVEVEQFPSKIACERVKEAFLSEPMKVTPEELTGQSWRNVRVIRKAICVGPV